ncbi:lytic transglycosylase domain-containing protein [Bacillus sp. REN3]|uniref:lytic transglycosylase domain-containing protein n=1 Tax=Bacillus sp. REN3 TaxID=2802440 RepID=UPI001AEDF750|nr:lytic transglycosylase domain-containing protein [Bacillus sp. REN3]
MNIEQLKAMIELQALQNFSKPAGQSGNGLFQEMLSGMLDGKNQVLGTVATLVDDVHPAGNVNQDRIFNLAQNSIQQMLPPVQLTKLSLKNNDFDEIVEQAAAKYNLPVKLIKSVIQKESNFNPNAVSPAGASGLMQLMPSTARGLGVKNIFDPAENIFAGTKYLRQMMDKYDGRLELALAAYNAGPGNVDKYGGIPPFRETQNYVQKIRNMFYG